MFNGYTGAQFLEETLHHWSQCIVLGGMIKEISCNSNDELETRGLLLLVEPANEFFSWF